MDKEVSDMINGLAPTIAAVILSIFGVLVVYGVFNAAVAAL